MAFLCTECHTYEGEGGGTAPDMTDYGSADWIRGMIMAPQHKSRYGKDNAMPLFRNLDGPAASITREGLGDHLSNTIHISDVERELIIRWMVKDYRVVFGGETISGPPIKVAEPSAEGSEEPADSESEDGSGGDESDGEESDDDTEEESDDGESEGEADEDSSEEEADDGSD